jgi:parvulin-like peptidyl-prolyl isomerase
MLRTALFSLLALGVVAQEPAKATPKVAGKAKTAKSLPEVKPVVLARVGGEAITEADFQSAFKLLGQQEQMSVLMMQGGKEEFVKRMAESKLISVKAKRLGLDKGQGYQLALKRAKDDLLAREFLAKEGDVLQKKLAVDEAGVKAFYDNHPERFKQPDLVSVRHILVSVKQGEGQTGLSDADAKVRIAKVQDELKGGAKFEDLAKTYSDDPGSKDNGGLYADADPSGWVPEFGAAARTQPVGEVGAPVKTAFGYHLIKVENRKASRQIAFDEAKGSALKMAQQERQAIVWNELMNDLRKEIPFELTKPAPAPKAPEPAKSPEASKAPEPVKSPEASKAPVADKGEAK